MARGVAWDQGFVAAGPGRVYGEVADPRRYGAWWPGAAVDSGDPILLRLPGVPPLQLSREDARSGTGVVFRVGGRAAGRWEWYLEPFEEGTIINVLLDVELAGSERARRRGVHRLRSAVRRGLVGMKAALE